MTTTVKGYAKINLHLDVCSIREDGFHSVRTVMQSLSLCDDVSVTLCDCPKIKAKCNVPGVPEDDKNIAVRAARKFFEKLGYTGGALIEIYKRIPMAAGLAGGSADAAAVLVALNELFDNALSAEELFDLGASLGSDVPFCIACGTLYSDGRGEILHGFEQMSDDICFVVACGGEGVSTPWGYALLDSAFDRFEGYLPKSIDELKSAIGSGDKYAFCDHMFNIFEAPVMSERPIARLIKSTIVESGARCAMMSGSGPSVFGVFEREKDAVAAQRKIEELGYFAAVARPQAARMTICS